jgi:hypothetical protein
MFDLLLNAILIFKVLSYRWKVHSSSTCSFNLKPKRDTEFVSTSTADDNFIKPVGFDPLTLIRPSLSLNGKPPTCTSKRRNSISRVSSTTFFLYGMACLHRIPTKDQHFSFRV